MALTEQQKQIVLQKAQGAGTQSQPSVAGELDKKRNAILEERAKPKTTLGKVAEFVAPTTRKTVQKLKAGEDLTTRQKLGTALEIGSFFVPGGAVAKGLGRTASFASRLGRAVGTGAVSGGAFEAGRALGEEDLSTKEVLKRTAVGGTIGGGIGAAFPLIGAGTGAIVKGAQKFPDTTLGTQIGELGERLPRAFGRGTERVATAQQRAQKIKTSTPAVQNAIKSNLDDRFIDNVTNSDTVSLQAKKEMVELAEKSKDRLGGPKINERPSIVAGRTAEEQFGLIEQKRKDVGSQIGEAVKKLSKDRPVDISTSIRELQNVLEAQGVKFDNGTLTRNSFRGTNITPNQRNKIIELWDLSTEAGGNLTPEQIWKKDNLFSKLQREARFEGVSDILIDTPEGQKNLFGVFRDVFNNKLDEVSPDDLRTLRREYHKLLTFKNDLESTILKTAKQDTLQNVGKDSFAQVNLRRIMSEAQSAAGFDEMVTQLDVLARELGYEGADPADLIRFAEALKDVFPESIPETSFRGGISKSIPEVAQAVSNIGKPNVVDQQRALKELIEEMLRQ